MKRLSSVAAALACGLALSPVAAHAQVAYGAAPDAYGPARNGIVLPFGDASPYDVATGVRPSFEIIPTPNPYAPAVRVVERCLYPHGWNVTDFNRDINGTPPGIDHTCPVPPVYGRVRLHTRY